MSDHTDGAPKCRECGRFKVRQFDAQGQLERYVRFRPRWISETRYAARIADLKQNVAAHQERWDQHKQDEHAGAQA